MKELISIQTELKAPKSQRNNFANYNYRNLEDIMEALKPLLKKHGCSVMLSDSIELIGDRYYVKATVKLINSENASVECSAYAREQLDKKGMDSAQITGATSSYARKYACNGLFAIDDTKDADSMDNAHNDVVEKPKNAFKNKAERTQYITEITTAINEINPGFIKEMWSELNREQQQDLWSNFGTNQQAFIREALASKGNK